MKVTFKQFIIWTVVVAILTIVIILLLQRGCGNAPGTGKAPDSLYYKKLNDSISAAVLKGAKEDFAIIEQAYRDSIAKIHKVKPKQIIEYITVASEMETDLTPDTIIEKEYYPVERIDCPPVVKSMSQKFINRFYSADVKINSSFPDSSYLHLRGTDSISGLWNEVTEGKLFNRKKYLEFSITNSNPDVTINKITAFKSPEIQPKAWAVGAQLGYGYMFAEGEIRRSVYIGIGIQRNIIQFNLKKKN